MIDPTHVEHEAFKAALKPLGEVMAEIGKHPHDYTLEEAMRLPEVCVHAYHDYMLKHLSKQSYDEEIPL